MNKIRLRIVAKGLILVAIPLAFECAFVAVMTNLQMQSEAAARRSEQAREIADLTNDLIQQLYAELQSVRLNLAEFAPGQAHRERISSAREKIRRLRDLIGPENVSEQRVLDALNKAIDEGNSLILRAEKAFRVGDEAEELRIRIQARHFAERIITPELIAISEKHDAIAVPDMAVQAEFNKRTHLLLGLALLMSIAGTLALAFFTTRMVTRRLADLSDNSRRIARGEEPRPVMGGNDEIAELDLNLHKMAAAIKHLLHRERLIFEHARDIICVTDNQLTISRISPSAETSLGLTATEIEGKSCLALLDRSHSQEAISRLLKASRGNVQLANFEAVLPTIAGHTVSMLISLSAAPEENNFILIFHDISKLKEAEREKQKVVKMVSTDLHLPLTRLTDILEKLESGDFGRLNQEGLDMLCRAKISSKQMSVLITDLLDLDKIDRGTLPLHTSTVSSRQLLEKAVLLSSQQARLAGCTVRIISADGLVQCDSDRVGQILNNLIGNALKFSPPGCEVLLRAESKSPLVQFSITDQGPGIPSEMRERIFERFEQARESDRQLGTGLGLTICKALVELQGGQIWVADSKYNIDKPGTSGSTFIFTLPEIRKQMGPAASLSS